MKRLTSSLQVSLGWRRHTVKLQARGRSKPENALTCLPAANSLVPLPRWLTTTARKRGTPAVNQWRAPFFLITIEGYEYRLVLGVTGLPAAFIGPGSLSLKRRGSAAAAGEFILGSFMV
jgi:hypothetical protein